MDLVVLREIVANISGVEHSKQIFFSEFKFKSHLNLQTIIFNLKDN